MKIVLSICKMFSNHRLYSRFDKFGSIVCIFVHPSGVPSNLFFSEIRAFVEVLSGVEEEKTRPKRRFECSHRRWASHVKIEPESLDTLHQPKRCG
jgi:hypothetical protein